MHTLVIGPLLPV